MSPRTLARTAAARLADTARHYLAIRREQVARRDRAESIGGRTVAAYFAEEPVNLYQIRQWLGPLEALDERHPVVLLVRHAVVAETLRRETRLPIVFALTKSELDAEIEALDLRLVLYVNQGFKNFQMLQLQRPAHVHLSHGESAKVSMVSNQLKAYDYAFIAGSASRERIEAALYGEPMGDRLIEIGRPQIDFFLTGARDATAVEASPTLFYAPTWEGENPGMSYSSVRSHGLELVRSAIAAGFRVIFRPHPRTGVARPSHRAAARAIAAELRRAGSAHIVDLAPDFGWQLGAAQICVADVSAVAVDWLSTGKPLLVTDPDSAAVRLDGDELMGAVPRLAAADAARSGEILREMLATGPCEKVAGLTARYFGESTPGTATRRWLEAADRVIRERSREIARRA